MKLPPAMVNWCLNATSSVKFVANAGCGVNALSGLQKHADSIYCRINVDTVMACKFFPGPVSRIAGMPDTAPSGAVFFIPSYATRGQVDENKHHGALFRFKVFHRDGELCERCGGIIEKTTLSSRPFY